MSGTPEPTLEHPGLDAAELLAAAHRMRHLCGVLDRCRPCGPSPIGEGRFHDLHLPGDGSTSILTGIEDTVSGRPAERYDLSGIDPACRSFAVQAETVVDALLEGSDAWPSARWADRLRRHADAVEAAARRASDPSAGPAGPTSTPVRTLAAVIAETLPGTLPSISFTYRTLTHPDGRLEAYGTLRSPPRTKPVPILREAALARLAAVARPAGTFSMEMRGSRPEYRIGPVEDAAQPAPPPDEPVLRMRLAASFPDLGPDPFTDAFLDLHARLAR